jgi:lysozyme family protein
MNKLTKYNSFLIERQFTNIIDDIFRLVESDGKWTGDNTYEWDIEKDNSIKGKLKRLLEKLPKEDIKKYFYKLIDKLKNLPSKTRKKLIISYSSVFLAFVSVGYLIPTEGVSSNLSQEIRTELTSILRDSSIKKEVKKVQIKKAIFIDAQDITKQAEGGFSNDKGDTGNYHKGVFIGTNHGISAPILAEYLGKMPTMKDMKNLTYETSLEIYKKNYWDAQNLGKFNDQSVANILYDGSVNQGKTGMRSVLRKSLIENGVKITDNDNPFNDKWVDKINKLDQESLFISIKKYREERYKSAKTFSRHGDGWLSRLDTFEYEEENNILT